MDRDKLQDLLDSLDEGPLGKPDVYWERIENIKQAVKIRQSFPKDIQDTWQVDTEVRKRINKLTNESRKLTARKKAEERGQLKPVAAYKNGILFKTWPCLKDAAKQLNANVGNLRGAVNGRQATALGMTWKYINKNNDKTR